MNGVLVSLVGIVSLTLVTIFGDVDAMLTVPAIAGLAGYTGGFAAGRRAPA